jgi:hypothetical protein
MDVFHSEAEMIISDIMLKLQAIRDEIGDLPVTGDYEDPEITISEEKVIFVCIFI